MTVMITCSRHANYHKPFADAEIYFPILCLMPNKTDSRRVCLHIVSGILLINCFGPSNLLNARFIIIVWIDKFSSAKRFFQFDFQAYYNTRWHLFATNITDAHFDCILTKIILILLQLNKSYRLNSLDDTLIINMGLHREWAADLCHRWPLIICVKMKFLLGFSGQLSCLGGGKSTISPSPPTLWLVALSIY